MLLDFQEAVVTKIIDETYNTKRFFLQIQGTTNFIFKAGQFITLDLPIHESKNKRLRSYSIASAPDGTNVIELIIVLLPGGLGTEYLFKQVAVNHILKFRGAQGHFCLPDAIPNNLYFISTGTGIAPFRSMLQYLHQQNIPHQNLYLINGVRTQKDLLYDAEMQALQNNLNGFAYLPTLSRQEWVGNNGYVHAVYEKLCVNQPNAEFYLCGWRAMIDEAREKLKQLGYDKKQIHFELYG